MLDETETQERLRQGQVALSAPPQRNRRIFS